MLYSPWNTSALPHPHHARPVLPILHPPHLYSIHTSQALCKLCLDYGHIMKQPALVERSKAILRSAEWGKRLGQHGVLYTKAFRGGMEEKKKVADALLRNREVELSTVLEYCW